MNTVSIEYAHIYTNQHISQEHDLSVSLLDKVTQDVKVAGKTPRLFVMVDDYSFPDPSFDYTQFIEWLSSKGFAPDFMIRESQLIPVCDEVLRLIQDETLKNQINDYVKAKKYPCSLFIAAWYLLRLGKVSSPIFPAELICEEIINILPESFKPFEDKGLEIIASTLHKDVVSKISYEFIAGRLIA